MNVLERDTWITVSQFRTHMHRVLRELEDGQTFVIARRGRPVARLIRKADPIPEEIEAVTRRHRDVEPTVPLVESGLPVPKEWERQSDGSPMPNVIRAIRLARAAR